MGGSAFTLLACCLVSVINATPEVPAGLPRPLEVAADRTTIYPRESLFILSGNVCLIYGDISLSADRVVLDRARGRATAVGNVILWDRGEQIFGDEAIYDFQRREGVILNAEYDGLALFVKADRIALRQTDQGREYLVEDGRVTTCELPIPHYHLAPRLIRIIPEKKVVVYDTAAYIDKVPVAYLPYYRRSLRDRPYGYVFTPGYSSGKGAMFLNKFTYHRDEWIRPRLYLDGYTEQGVGVGAANRFGKGEGTEFDGRIYGYYIDSKSGNPYLEDDDNIGKDIDEERWRAAGHFYREVAEDLVFSSRFQELSDEDFNRDFDDIGRHHNFSSQDLESDRNSFANLARRWDDYNLRVLYKERLHDFHLTELPDDERKPQLVFDAKENRILDSPIFWDALLQYDRDLRLERQRNLEERPALGIDDRDDFLSASGTDRLHGEAVFSAPFSAGSPLRVIPRAGVLANSYQDTRRSLRYTDHFGDDDSFVDQEFDSVDQAAVQAGVEVNSRLVFDLGGPVGSFQEMRLVTEPNLSFDAYGAREDLTAEDPATIESGGPLAGRLPALLDVPAGYPEFDERDFPLRDAEILAFRLDTHLQGKRREGGKVNVLSQSFTVAYDFDANEYADLQSEIFLQPAPGLRLSNFLSYELNEGFGRNASVGADIGPIRRVSLSAFYSSYRETVESDRQETLIAGVDFPVGDKYAVGLSSRFDLDDGDVLRTGIDLSRDLHDAVARLAVRYTDGKKGEDDEVDVHLYFELGLSRPAEFLGDAY